MRHDRHDHGFTLIEILMAIVLVGILSAVVIVGVKSMTDKGSGSACTASRDAASAAAVSYYAAHRAFPTAIQPLVDDGLLTLPDDVTVTAPLVATGNGWTLTMVPAGSTTTPGFTCS